MGFLQNVKKSFAKVPRRTVLYGPEGVGKSTFAANLFGIDNTIFVDTERGLSNINVDTFPFCRHMHEAMGQVMELGSPAADHKYKCVVVDSIDWFERLCWKHVCQDAGKQDVAEIGYGKGYTRAAGLIEKFLEALEHCRLGHHMEIILIAHSAIAKFESPEGASYDRYQTKLHKISGPIVNEWADEIFFCNYQTFTKVADESFGKERTIGFGSGERILKTTQRPSHIAKNRLGMPDEIPMRVSVYHECVRKAYSETLGEQQPTPVPVPALDPVVERDPVTVLDQSPPPKHDSEITAGVSQLQWDVK